MADMEGQSRSIAGVSQLESKIQDLEERLLSEERYIATNRLCIAFFICLTTKYLKCTCKFKL